MSGVFIIAEAGVNHNGSLARAKEMVAAAAEAGADAVKFQAFRADALTTRGAAKAAYQVQATGAGESQQDMLRKLELSDSDFGELKECCAACRIEFLASPFDLAAIGMLQALGLRKWKIPSGEITNLPYLRKIGSLGNEIILSTGMADLGEIGAALSVLESAGTDRGQMVLLHCTTEYPAPFGDVNLRAMNALREAFPGLKGVGYSDHTPGIEVPIAAVALGASVIEKHFTLDKNLPGPDHRASLEPRELAAMARAIRNIEQALGDGTKRLSPAEENNKQIVRKSIVAAQAIAQGEAFTAQNLAVKRPGTGVSPMRWDDVVGQRARRDYAKDDFIDA